MKSLVWLTLAAALLPLNSIKANEFSTIECLAYWQLRGVGLTREGGIKNAIKVEQYASQYQTVLAGLKEELPPADIVNELFAVMNKQLTIIDFDYDKTSELDERYLSACPIKVDKS